MLFEVIRNKKVLMSTAYEECIPPPEVLQQMVAAGYTFRKDNKAWKPPIERKKSKKKNNDIDID